MKSSEESNKDIQDPITAVSQIGGDGSNESEKVSVSAPPGNGSNESIQEKPSTRKEKRGMKPKSKRNRKRPRSIHSIEEPSYQTNVRRLEIDGKPITSSTGWLRTVEPYPYTFSTFAKARWVGRTVLDVYHAEFGSYPKSYYESAIAQGRILVSDQIVELTHLIKDGDVLTHTVHRHEPGVAVYSQEPPFVRIVQETSDVLVVDKPGTLPVHPCGGYHVQSLMNLLEPQFGKLYTIHRLDRLTSGLLILGKSSSIAQEWGKCIMNRNCQKAYLARVAGKFPLNCSTALCIQDQTDGPENGEWTNVMATDESVEKVTAARKRNAHGYWIVDGGGSIQKDVELQRVFESKHSEEEWLQPILEGATESTEMLWFHLACPTRVAQPKDGICEAGNFENVDNELYMKTVKPAETSFGVVRYDEATDSTVVVCRPATGRTHQIRLHLQYLGHPIANDPNYGGDLFSHNPEGKEACRMAQERLDAINIANKDEIDRLTQGENKLAATASATARIDVPATEEEIQKEVSAAVQGETETIHDFIKRTCVWCARCGNGGSDRTALEFLIRSPGIWLHALHYNFIGLDGTSSSYRAPLPSWH